MKYTAKLYIPVLLMVVIFFNSCIKEKYSTPDQIISKVDFTSTLTIAQLKTADLAPTGLLLIGDSLKLTSGDVILNPIIQGIVSADDESGNIYKTLYLQDNTGGIQIAIDKTSLYTTFKKGQRVFVKLKGLYLGTYGGMTQIGYTYGGAIGRMPEVLINSHIFNDSLPGPAPIPLERTIGSISGNDMNMLVRLKDVHFAETEVGLVFADINVTTNRNLYDSAGTSIPVLLRNSGYANFRASLIPQGHGDIVGIMSAYNGAKQFYIRDLNDLENWDTIVNFPTSIINEPFNVAPTNWTIYSVASNKNWYWINTYTAMIANGIGGDAPSDDWLISPEIDLTNITNASLVFSTWTKYIDSGNALPLEVFTSVDFTGNPQTATWVQLNAILAAQNSQTSTPSGTVDLSSFTGKFHIGYRYKSSGISSGTCASWELESFIVKGIKH